MMAIGLAMLLVGLFNPAARGTGLDCALIVAGVVLIALGTKL
jgi:hypothetical protein